MSLEGYDSLMNSGLPISLMRIKLYIAPSPLSMYYFLRIIALSIRYIHQEKGYFFLYISTSVPTNDVKKLVTDFLPVHLFFECQ